MHSGGSRRRQARYFNNLGRAADGGTSGGFGADVFLVHMWARL